MRKPGVAITSQEVEQIIRLTAAGHTGDDVAGLVGVSRRTVVKVIKENRPEVAQYKERMNPDTLSQMEILRDITQDNQPACTHCKRPRTSNDTKIKASVALRSWAQGLMRDEVEEELTAGLPVGPPTIHVYEADAPAARSFTTPAPDKPTRELPPEGFLGDYTGDPARDGIQDTPATVTKIHE